MKDHKGNLTLGHSKTKLDHNALAVAYCPHYFTPLKTSIYIHHIRVFKRE